MTVNPKCKVALVGEAGCGKSSCMALLQRLYDPDHGSIRLDGVDLREYNVNALRSRVVIVDQKPVLFATSVRENITYGLQHDVSDTWTVPGVFLSMFLKVYGLGFRVWGLGFRV
ncbi:ABCB4 [Symbiodinium natans]|uniref:ABCB4 protein n=1 Tax=Symbiodinium natans TaxID=878477 RepID=A0A812N7K9_9DINO|nr:ABCB4 [Symbiodinium natans]